MRKPLILILIVLFGFNPDISAQESNNQVIQINAVAEADGMTLKWASRTFTGTYQIFRRNNLSTLAWGNAIAIIPSTSTSYKDNFVTPGKACDYWVVAVQGTSAISFGYVYAGNQLKETPYKGGIVLLIDSNYMLPLSAEINRLKLDLIAEGWDVNSLYAGRNSSPLNVKNRLVPFVQSRKIKVSTLLIIGHIPVPYSGGFTGNSSKAPPDGHNEGNGNHTGAWPADVYYGDMNGIWEDFNVNITSGNLTRNHNVPDDGKFDPNKIPSSIELEVGRIDLFDMPMFGISDTLLIKNYLNRNHAWRTGKLSVIERGLVDDNFTSLSLASTGLQNFAAFFPIDSVFGNKDYMTELKNHSYLWSYGCGPGSYTSCSGIGNSNNFVSDSLKHIFTILSGSYFGDWDITNNFLRAPLGRSALASFWGGIPKWYIHTMAMGKHLGYGTRITQNNYGFYYTGAFNNSDSLVTIALMGDPTLCNRHLPYVNSLTAVSQNKQVKLNWNKPAGTYDGYVVYRHDTVNNVFHRVNKGIINDSFYTDSFNFYSGNYRYIVRTIKKETTGSGTYYNLGGGASADVNHTNSINGISKPALKFYPNPLVDILHFDEDGLHQFEIFDMAGRKYEIHFTPNSHQIDLGSLPVGPYILRCLDANGYEITTTLIKQ